MTLSTWYIAAALTSSMILAACEYLFPDQGFSTLFTVSPSIIAFAFAYFDKDRPLNSLGWRPNFRYWLVIFGFIAAVTAILLLIAWRLGHIEINHKALQKFLQLETMLGLVLGIVMNTGEEAGWRGYMFPKLYKQRGWWSAIFISSIVWWAWHVPFMAVLQLRQFGEIQWGTQAIHLLGIVPATVMYSYWFLKSESFWAIGFAHQLGNFVNKWFLGLEHAAKAPIFFADKSLTHIYSTENGVLGIAVVSIGGSNQELGQKQQNDNTHHTTSNSFNAPTSWLKYRAPLPG